MALERFSKKIIYYKPIDRLFDNRVRKRDKKLGSVESSLF